MNAKDAAREKIEQSRKPLVALSHRIHAHRHGRIALLHSCVRAHGNTQPLGHHRGGQAALATRQREIGAEFRQRSPDLGRQNIMDRILQDAWQALDAAD